MWVRVFSYWLTFLRLRNKLNEKQICCKLPRILACCYVVPMQKEMGMVAGSQSTRGIMAGD